MRLWCAWQFLSVTAYFRRCGRVFASSPSLNFIKKICQRCWHFNISLFASVLKLLFTVCKQFVVTGCNSVNFMPFLRHCHKLDFTTRLWKWLIVWFRQEKSLQRKILSNLMTMMSFFPFYYFLMNYGPWTCTISRN